MPAQFRRDFAQHDITGGMAMGVVEGFEVVDVDHGDGVVAGQALHRLVECAPVAQSRECIDEGHAIGTDQHAEREHEAGRGQCQCTAFGVRPLRQRQRKHQQADARRAFADRAAQDPTYKADQRCEQDHEHGAAAIMITRPQPDKKTVEPGADVARRMQAEQDGEGKQQQPQRIAAGTPARFGQGRGEQDKDRRKGKRGFERSRTALDACRRCRHHDRREQGQPLSREPDREHKGERGQRDCRPGSHRHEWRRN